MTVCSQDWNCVTVLQAIEDQKWEGLRIKKAKFKLAFDRSEINSDAYVCVE